MSDLRPSGIRFVPGFSWGSHVCVLYSSPEDLAQLLVPYFHAGLTNNESCLWITSKELPVSIARKVMRQALRNTDTTHLESNVEIISQSEWYLKHRRLDTEGVRKVWMKKISDALEQGYQGLRVCGIIPWLNEKQLEAFQAYEKKLDEILAQKQIITLCAYSIQKYSIAQLMKALHYHGFVLIQIHGKCELIELSQRRLDVSSTADYRTLTARERQVMRLVSEGLTNTEIGTALSISVRTVEAHRSNLMRKLGLRNQADLIRFALTADVPPSNHVELS